MRRSIPALAIWMVLTTSCRKGPTARDQDQNAAVEDAGADANVVITPAVPLSDLDAGNSTNLPRVPTFDAAKARMQMAEGRTHAFRSLRLTRIAKYIRGRNDKTLRARVERAMRLEEARHFLCRNPGSADMPDASIASEAAEIDRQRCHSFHNDGTAPYREEDVVRDITPGNVVQKLEEIEGELAVSLKASPPSE